MSNPFNNEARKDHGDKLNRMVGHRGEYPPDRAERIAKTPAGDIAKAADYKRPGIGDAAKEPEEVYVGSPARQISNYGKVRK